MQLRVHGREQEFGLGLIFDRKFRDTISSEDLDDGVDHYNEEVILSLLKSFSQLVPAVPNLGSSLDGNVHDYWLSNGARAYRDAELLEVATAECLIGTRQLIAQERAIDLIINGAILKVLPKFPMIKEIRFFRGNTTSGIAETSWPANSYGSHHNYSYQTVKRREIFTILINFLPVSLIFSGSGDLVFDGTRTKYVISSRAPHIKLLTGIRNSEDRSLIHLREESLMEPSANLARLHLICRDTTRLETQTWLVDMMTHLMIRLGEESWIVPKTLRLSQPLQELGRINSDLDLSGKVMTKGKNQMDLVSYNRIFLNAAKQLKPLSEAEKKALEMWEERLDFFSRGALSKMIGEIDWITKKYALDWYCKRFHFGLNNHQARILNHSYHNISDNPNKSLFARLDRGGIVRHLVSKEEIVQSMEAPPPTRAYARGAFVKKHWRHPKRRQNIKLIGWTHANMKKGGDIPFGVPNKPWLPLTKRGLSKNNPRY